MGHEGVSHYGGGGEDLLQFGGHGWGTSHRGTASTGCPSSVARAQPSLVVPSGGLLHSQHTFGWPRVGEAVLAVPLSVKEQLAFKGC